MALAPVMIAPQAADRMTPRWCAVMRLLLPTAEVISRLDGEVPSAPVHYAEHIAADPHVAARHMIKTVEHPSGSPIDIAGAPIKFGHGEDQAFTRAPLLGEHNEELLPPRP